MRFAGGQFQHQLHRITIRVLLAHAAAVQMHNALNQRQTQLGDLFELERLILRNHQVQGANFFEFNFFLCHSHLGALAFHKHQHVLALKRQTDLNRHFGFGVHLFAGFFNGLVNAFKECTPNHDGAAINGGQGVVRKHQVKVHLGFDGGGHHFGEHQIQGLKHVNAVKSARHFVAKHPNQFIKALHALKQVVHGGNGGRFAVVVTSLLLVFQGPQLAAELGHGGHDVGAQALHHVLELGKTVGLVNLARIPHHHAGNVVSRRALHKAATQGLFAHLNVFAMREFDFSGHGLGNDRAHHRIAVQRFQRMTRVDLGGLVGKIHLAVDGKGQQRGTHRVQQPNHRIGVHGGGHIDFPMWFCCHVHDIISHFRGYGKKLGL